MDLEAAKREASPLPARSLPLGPVEHSLKCDSEAFIAVMEGRKTHEIRFDDRGYRVGDVLWLMETAYSAAEMRAGAPALFTGREIRRIVSHVLTGYGLVPGWVCLSLSLSLSLSRSRSLDTAVPKEHALELATAAISPKAR